MNDSDRRIRLWMRTILVLVLLVDLPNGNAQTERADGHGWMTCGVDWILTDYRSGPNFDVRVAFREQPISGVKVSLTRRDLLPYAFDGHLVSSDTTDSKGIAHFFRTPAGVYVAHVDEGLLAQSQELEVEEGNASSEEIDIEWPSAPIVTRSIRGSVFSWQQSTPQNRSQLLPLQHAMVQLLDLRSGRLLGSTHTSAQGYYEFATPDGLYVLRISEHKDPSVNEYDQALEVTPRATRERMPDLEVDGGCGLILELPERLAGLSP
jgi:hypothetical protein